MARRTFGLLGMSLLLALPVVGCAEPDSSMDPDDSLQDDIFTQSNVSKYFASQNDQGLLADMSIFEGDFVPHSAALSGSGEERLERYAELLAGRGGKLNYDASTTDQELIASRLETATCFLAEAAPSDHTIMVVQGLPGGRGMTGRDALAAREVGAEPEPRNTAYQLSDTKGNREKGN